MNYTVATDIGNSETKMILEDVLIKQPSIVAALLTRPTAVESDATKNVANLLDELIVNITSKSIKRNGLYAIGKKANLSGGSVQNMNIKLGNKHLHDIPVIMSLSLIAARAIQLDFDKNSVLASDLSLIIEMSSAIPASEYTPDKARILESRFVDYEHVVIVYVGDELVTVKIKFEEVKVTQEGNPAIYAIISGEPAILRLYNEKYKKKATPKDFRNKKILHLDIGDGTTEFIYTVGSSVKSDASSGERLGVGHATQEALKLFLEQLGIPIKMNRQQFMDVLRDVNHHFHNEAISCMDLAKISQSALIIEDTQEKYIEKTNGDVDIFSVYGGGSIQFEDTMYMELVQFAESVKAEVLWIPEEFAVDLNAIGLDVLNKNVFFKG